MSDPRTSMDPERDDGERPKSAPACPETIDLFSVVVPNVRTPAPSAPGSESSRRGAEIIDPFRSGLYRKIMLALGAATRPVSREALSALLDVKETTLCGRLSELRPDWIEAVDGVCLSAAGVHVDGYRLTARGRARLTEAA